MAGCMNGWVDRRIVLPMDHDECIMTHVLKELSAQDDAAAAR